MKLINRKLSKDLGTAKALFTGVSLVVFLGVALFGAAFMAFENLKISYDYSYQVLNFADYTIKVNEAPARLTSDLQSIPGIKDIAGRINTDLPLKLPDSNITVLARVISLPGPERAAVNDVKVEEGAYFSSGSDLKVLVEKSFADHHSLSPGDMVSIIVNGQTTRFEVSGIVTSPEYIFAAKSREELLVSPDIFGVIFIPQETLATLLNQQTLNEFCFTIASGTDANTVLQQVESVLTPYSILDVVPKDEQPSNSALKLDLQEFGELGQVFPILFLVIGALATYILITRIVQNQRTQIGLMRALGYSRREVMFHYLSFALVIGISGAVIGTIAGYFLSGAVTRLYITILGLPFTVIEANWAAMAEGIAIGIIPSVIAGILPARAASRLTPAEAMRPPPPPRGRTPWLEKLLPFLNRLRYTWKMPLRNMFRNRNRSLSVIFGVAFGLSLVLVSLSFLDSIDSLLKLQFDKIQKYDAQLDFSAPQSPDIVTTVAGWNQVTEAQPVLKQPVRFSNGGSTYATLLVGIVPGSDLYGIFDTSGNPIDVPAEGILLGEGLKKGLGIQQGDQISVQTVSGTTQLTVTGFVKQPMGSFGYVSLDTAQTLAGQPVISGVMLAVKPGTINTLRDTAAADLPGASVELTSETKAVLNTLFKLLDVIMLVMAAFGAALALVIVFTMVTLSILERRREVATMRTLGETRGKIAAMVTIENLMLGIAGIIPGIVIGYAIAWYFFSLFQSDMFSFDLVVYPRTYLLSAGLIIIIVLISQIPGIRQMNRLDLAKVIKEQER